MARQELYVIGIPGGGKTTWLSQQVADHVEAGHIPFVSSLTRAAAIEIASRGIPVEDRMVGTLHSMAYHAIGGADIIETKKELIEEWNNDHKGNQINVSGRIDDTMNSSSGENFLGAAFKYRQSRERMPQECADILQEWDNFKDSNGVLDFTDLLEFALDTDSPGYYPTAYFIDEAQDLSRLEVELVRKWASHPDVEQLICVGDPDQAIYGFRSGRETDLLYPDGEKDIRVLEQSFRVPRKPQEFSRDWIRGIPGRFDYSWNPTDRDGELIDSHEDSSMLVDTLPGEGDVMILASAAYMLNGVIAMLESKGVPYHNPYRRAEGKWNPFGSTRGTTTRERLQAFFKPENGAWTAEQIKLWNSIFPATKVFRERGMKKKIEEDSIPNFNSKNEMNRHFLSDEMLNILNLLNNRSEKIVIEFMEKNKAKKLSNPLERLLKFVKASNSDVLAKEPRVIVGTIHSVKGGEADTVYVMDGISWAAEKSASSDTLRKSYSIYDYPDLRRLFYVAFTRASKSLRLCRTKKEMGRNYVHPFINKQIDKVGDYA